MWNTKATYPFSGITMVLLCGLLLHSCQYHLQVYGDGEATPTEGAPNQEGANTLGISTETARASRKRPAEERLQDIEEKKDSPTSLGHSSFGTTSTTMSTQNVTARITQESQESTAMTLASGQATTAPAKKALQDVAVTQEGAKTVCKKDDNTADQEQKIPADLSRWFKEFAEAVDDEDVRYLGNISEAIPRLVQEGKKKGYLMQAVKLPINEVGWAPDCTPLHYAAAKGNVQAVEALLREPEVIINARTEDNETTPLQFAAFDGHLGAAELLIEAYKRQGKIGEIDARDKDGLSALQSAAAGPRGHSNQQVAELLIDQGADPAQLFKNRSPLLSLSAIAGNLAMVEYWVEEIACTGRFSRDQDKKFIERAIKLAKLNKHIGVATILQDYYKRSFDEL